MSINDSPEDRGSSEGDIVHPERVPPDRYVRSGIFGDDSVHEPALTFEQARDLAEERLSQLGDEPIPEPSTAPSANARAILDRPPFPPYLALHEGLASRLSSGLRTQMRYEQLFAEAAAIRVDRVTKRGEYRYYNNDPMSKDALAADLFRKFHRVYMYLTGRAQDYSKADLREDFLDLANYGIMGVQVGEIEGWL